MKILFSCFFVAFLLGSKYQCVYHRKIENCGGLNGFDKTWSLNIKSDNSFVLDIISRNNDYLSKPKQNSLIGFCKVKEDTILLYNWGNIDNPLMFYDSNDTLFFQRNLSNLKEPDLVYLDYLTRSNLLK